MPEFGGWAFNDITTTGPDPFQSDNSGNSSSVGVSTITINPGVSPQILQVDDNDSNFEDGDGSQEFAVATTFNGKSYGTNDEIETEYSYIVRPQGSSDPADNITIYVLDLEGDAEGIAADGHLLPGVTYDIIAIDSNDPSVPFASLFVCFDTGTMIATPGGERPVEDLQAGDMVMTMDDGARPLCWVGRRTLILPERDNPQKPIQFAKGSLGNGLPHRDLVISPQHRVLMGEPEVRDLFGHAEILALAKGLLPLPGVRIMRGRSEVTYHTLLLERHAILWAEGAAVESFYPGPYAMSLLERRERAAVRAKIPNLISDPEHGYGPHARPVVLRCDAETLARRLRDARFPALGGTRPQDLATDLLATG